MRHIWLLQGLCLWAALLIGLILWSNCFSYESFQQGLVLKAGERQNAQRTTVPTYWFIQISDLHINKHAISGAGYENFEYFLDNVVPLIQPKFVLATGDITDARRRVGFGSGQYRKEWELYREALEKRGLSDPSFWYDLRGNHDCFRVGSPKDDLFGEFGIQSKSNYSFRMDGITFLAIDGCPRYGLAAPYNFFGALRKDAIDELERKLEEVPESGDYVVLLGHYPTVTLQSQRSSKGTSFAQLTNKIDYYLTGHLHKFLFGLGETLKAVHPNGLKDFELADLKHHKAFRVGVLNQGILTFHDFTLEEDPFVCLLAPEDARWSITRDHDSLRVLVFSKERVSSVSARFGQNLFNLSQEEAEEKLWTVKVNLESSGNVEILVKLESGSSHTISRNFSLKQLVPSKEFGSYLLKWNFRCFIIYFFAFVYLALLSTFILTFLRFNNSESIPRYLSIFKDTNPSITIIAWLCYLSTGPWCCGNLSSNGFSFVFLQGILQGTGQWTIILDTWFYATVHFFTFIIPSVLLLGIYSMKPIENILQTSTAESAEDEDVPIITCDKPQQWFQSVPFKLLIAIWFGFGISRIGFVLLNYGILTSIISPVYTWYTLWFTYKLVDLSRKKLN